MGGFIVKEHPIESKPGDYEITVAQGSLIMSVQRNIGQDPYILVFGWPEAESHLGQSETRKIICVATGKGMPVNQQYRPLGKIRIGYFSRKDLHYFEVMPQPKKA